MTYFGTATDLVRGQTVPVDGKEPMKEKQFGRAKELCVLSLEEIISKYVNII